MTFFAQPPFLSIMSGLIAVVLYHFCAPKPQDASVNPTEKKFFNVQTKAYLMVFLVVAVLVYGSFLIAQNGGGVRYANLQPEIQTGGRPPF